MTITVPGAIKVIIIAPGAIILLTFIDITHIFGSDIALILVPDTIIEL